MTVAQAMSAALSLLPPGSVLLVDYQGAGRERRAYVGVLTGFGGESFALRTRGGVRRFLARTGRLFGVEVVRLGKAGA